MLIYATIIMYGCVTAACFYAVFYAIHIIEKQAKVIKSLRNAVDEQYEILQGFSATHDNIVARSLKADEQLALINKRLNQMQNRMKGK